MAAEDANWGSVWLEQLGSEVGFDPVILARGGTVTQMGRVRAVEFEPGLVRAEVEGVLEEPEIVVVGVTLLGPDQWDDLVRRAVDNAAEAAAVLAGELPFEFASMLLPHKGQVSCDCTCKDGDDLCRHGAALCHQVAERLVIDPFALMLIRGRDKAEVLAALRSARATLLGVEQPTSSGLPRGVDSGRSASDSWRSEPSPPVVAPPAPRRPGNLPTLAVSPPAGSGIEEADLADLVADGALRARAMLAGTGDSGLGLSVGADVVRRAATGDIEQIARATKVPVEELAEAARAWRIGGEGGLKITRQSWDPGIEALVPGKEAIGPTARVRANAVFNERIQLRLDKDGGWWRFLADKSFGWVLDSVAVRDPSDLL